MDLTCYPQISSGLPCSNNVFPYLTDSESLMICFGQWKMSRKDMLYSQIKVLRPKMYFVMISNFLLLVVLGEAAWSAWTSQGKQQGTVRCKSACSVSKK